MEDSMIEQPMRFEELRDASEESYLGEKPAEKDWSDFSEDASDSLHNARRCEGTEARRLNLTMAAKQIQMALRALPVLAVRKSVQSEREMLEAIDRECA